MTTRVVKSEHQQYLAEGNGNVTDPIDGGLKLAAHQNGVASSCGCRGAHSSSWCGCRRCGSRSGCPARAITFQFTRTRWIAANGRIPREIAEKPRMGWATSHIENLQLLRLLFALCSDHNNAGKHLSRSGCTVVRTLLREQWWLPG